VIHRDIKPENILVSQDGYVKLADFGLARPLNHDAASVLTGTNVVMGTVDYMAPEQRQGQSDERADIFALGVMLYEMLTGQTPRGAFEPASRKIQVDIRIDEVVLRALQPEPDRRYQHVSEMKTDVDRIRNTPLPTPAPSEPAAQPPPPTAPKRKPGKPWVFAAAIGLLLLGIAAILIWRQRGRPPAGGGPVTPPAVAGEAIRARGETRAEPSPIVANQEAPFVNGLGMKFVPVPILGGPTAGQRMLFSVWDTRVQDYEVFIKETNRDWPKPDYEQGPTHPAVMVTWQDAQLFCQWLTLREQAAGRLPADWRYRLPSDHEWSCAVGIGAREDAEKLPRENAILLSDVFPWGREWPPPAGSGNYAGDELRPVLAAGKYPSIKYVISGYNDGFVNTSPVGSFRANTYGLYDMGGNVWQWCEDWFDASHIDRVLRGASWFVNSNIMSSRRLSLRPYSHVNDFGFRCVLAPAVSTALSGGPAVSPAPAPPH
jgi:hypothetical protein